jgi:hypothetical protein
MLIGTLVLVEAAAAQVAPDSLPATVSSRSGEKVSVEGLAEFRFGETLVVSGYRIHATPTTRFSGPEIAELSAVPLGYQVEAKGVVQPDGTILVHELEAKPRERTDAGRGVVSGALEQEGKWLSGSGSIFRAALERSAPETRLPKADPQYERVKGILTRMLPASLEESLRLHIVSSPDWNARGLPNGSIAVASGLLTDMDDDEVAIVLGHELAHITHQHAQKTLADAERRKLVTELIGDVIPEGGVLTRVALTVGGAVALKAWQSGYSRSLETEADRVGMGYAAAGGFDVRKAPHVWERFQQKYGSEQALKNFVVGNHPRNVERVKNARAELLAHYPNFVPSPVPVHTADVAPVPKAVSPADAGAALAPGGNQLTSGKTPTFEIKQGMTEDQVRALLGAPKEVLAFTTVEGRQTKWIFAHLKVTFLNGRVTAVEF